MLKQEIARLSRRELRGEMQATKKASTQYRHHIAALRRQLGALERQVATLQRRVGSGHRAEATASSEDGAPKLRFAANRLRAQRAKHGLTAGEYAKLLGVSEQTIYNWEHGTHRPGRDRLAVIAELRGLGKRAVQARLEEMPGKAASTKSAATKKRAANKSASKQRATKKPAARKSAREKPAAKKSTRPSPAANKTGSRTSTAKKSATKRGGATKQTRRGNAAPPPPEATQPSA
jgi:transcriptional regulator with XRE-family HTH domain